MNAVATDLSCPLQGFGFAALQEACRVTGSRLSTSERWQRPMMLPQAGDDAERYLRRALGQSYKKRMQQYRAVGKHGVLAFRRLRGVEAREAREPCGVDAREAREPGRDGMVSSALHWVCFQPHRRRPGLRQHRAASLSLSTALGCLSWAGWISGWRGQSAGASGAS